MTEDSRPMDAAMAARDAEFEQIAAFLKDKTAADCIECGKQEWQVFHDLNPTAIRSQIRPSLVGTRVGTVTTHALPMIAVMCGNCGYTKLFSAKVVLEGSHGYD